MTKFFEGCTTPAQIKEQWRLLSRRHHPDRGGDIEVFQQLKDEYDSVMKVAMTPVKCNACFGTGKLSQGTGFSNIYLKCHRCQGTGKIKRGEVE